MKTLGVDRRRDAARILAEAEGLVPYPRQVYPSRDIAIAAEPGTIALPSGGELHDGALEGRGVMEEQAGFTMLLPPRPRGLHLPLPFWGSRPSDLGWLRRLGWIIGIMFVTALMFGMFLAGLESLSRMSH
jgi:hypothetical protein